MPDDVAGWGAGVAGVVASRHADKAAEAAAVDRTVAERLLLLLSPWHPHRACVEAEAFAAAVARRQEQTVARAARFFPATVSDPAFDPPLQGTADDAGPSDASTAPDGKPTEGASLRCHECGREAAKTLPMCVACHVVRRQTLGCPQQFYFLRGFAVTGQRVSSLGPASLAFLIESPSTYFELTCLGAAEGDDFFFGVHGERRAVGLNSRGLMVESSRDANRGRGRETLARTSAHSDAPVDFGLGDVIGLTVRHEYSSLLDVSFTINGLLAGVAQVRIPQRTNVALRNGLGRLATSGPSSFVLNTGGNPFQYGPGAQVYADMRARVVAAGGGGSAVGLAGLERNCASCADTTLCVDVCADCEAGPFLAHGTMANTLTAPPAFVGDGEIANRASDLATCLACGFVLRGVMLSCVACPVVLCLDCGSGRAATGTAADVTKLLDAHRREGHAMLSIPAPDCASRWATQCANLVATERRWSTFCKYGDLRALDQVREADAMVRRVRAGGMGRFAKGAGFGTTPWTSADDVSELLPVGGGGSKAGTSHAGGTGAAGGEEEAEAEEERQVELRQRAVVDFVAGDAFDRISAVFPWEAGADLACFVCKNLHSRAQEVWTACPHCAAAWCRSCLGDSVARFRHHPDCRPPAGDTMVEVPSSDMFGETTAVRNHIVHDNFAPAVPARSRAASLVSVAPLPEELRRRNPEPVFGWSSSLVPWSCWWTCDGCGGNFDTWHPWFCLACGMVLYVVCVRARVCVCLRT